MLHLHRLQHQQWRAFLDGGTDSDVHFRDLAWHRRGELATAGILAHRCAARVVQLKAVGAAPRHHGDCTACRVHADIEAAPGDLHSQTARLAMYDAGVGGRGRQRHVIFGAAIGDLDGVAFLLPIEFHSLVDMLVQPPAMGGVPGGVWIQRPRGLRLRLGAPLVQQSEHRGCDHLVRGGRQGDVQVGAMLLDEVRVDVAVGKAGMARDCVQKGAVGRDAGDLGIRQRRAQPRHRLRPVIAADDQLGDHRVVVRRDLVALHDASVDPDEAVMLRKSQHLQSAGLRQEPARRVLGIQPHLDGMAVQLDIVLAERQRLAGCDAQLPLDQIGVGDPLGHRVLHLQAGVHLDEVEVLVRIHQEFAGAGTDIVDGPRRLDRGSANGGRCLRRQAGGRGLFDHLLVAALD